jgi:hypothetical protein
MKKTAAGSEVEAYCTKCKLVLAHTVVAMKDDKPKRVKCLTCEGEHNFRATKPKPRATKKSGTGRTTTKRSRQSWEEIMKEAADKPHKAYSMSGSYEDGDWIEHAKFGRGCVEAYTPPNKIKVRFADSTKILVCNRAGD